MRDTWTPLVMGRCTSCGDDSGEVFGFCPWCKGAPEASDVLGGFYADATSSRRFNDLRKRHKVRSSRDRALGSDLAYHGAG